jgi:signal peptidase I
MTTKKILRELVSRLLEEGNSIRIPADGYSMFPDIYPGDTIVITPIDDPSTLQEGEIIAWKREHDLVVHRIVSIVSNKDRIVITTRGDSSMAADQPIISETLAGRVQLFDKSGNEKLTQLRPNIPEWRYRLNWLRVRGIIIRRRIFG